MKTRLLLQHTLVFKARMTNASCLCARIPPPAVGGNPPPQRPHRRLLAKAERRAFDVHARNVRRASVGPPGASPAPLTFSCCFLFRFGRKTVSGTHVDPGETRRSVPRALRAPGLACMLGAGGRGAPRTRRCIRLCLKGLIKDSD